MTENTGFQRVILLTLLVHDKVFIDLKIYKDSFLKSTPFLKLTSFIHVSFHENMMKVLFYLCLVLTLSLGKIKCW